MFGCVADGWTPRKQGDAGEASAVAWFLTRGAFVFVPVAHTPSDYDLIVDLDGRVLRVQVKTSSCREGNRFAVAVCTRGGNQSWNGIVKRFTASRCDYLFVHVGDGRRWFIPAEAVEGGNQIMLGGPKYARYEVDSGAPLPARDRATEYTCPPLAG
jgi:PD-(D/E)XK endonuclease